MGNLKDKIEQIKIVLYYKLLMHNKSINIYEYINI